MADLLSDALDTMAALFDENAAVSCTYRRGATENTVIMTLGDRRLVTVIRDDTEVSEQRQDFIVTASRLPYSEPLSEDKIDFNGSTFEVAAPEDEGRHVFRPCDPYGKRLRIYTVLKND